jgi:enamine deaminase RidA (YjgF/YER057c/UK114 family)
VERSHAERRLIPGHSPYEQIVGFSRALVSGRTVHVAGTAPIPHEGDPPEGAYDQMRLCLELVGDALEQAGASFADVVRTRMFIVDAADWQEIARAHGEVFSEIRPASTAIVTGLLDPRWRVEIEAEAVLPA